MVKPFSRPLRRSNQPAPPRPFRSPGSACRLGYLDVQARALSESWKPPSNPHGIQSNTNGWVLIPLTQTPDVESAMGMELLLNLAWVLLAATMFCLWLRFAPRSSVSPHLQFMALAVLLLILFPVISVTDDLQAVQNPAEADCLVRRDHGPAMHSSLTPIAALPLPAIGGVAFGVLRMAIKGSPRDPVFDHPALAPIQNRPPPVA